MNKLTFLFCSLIFLSSCSYFSSDQNAVSRMPETTIEIEDPERHYYPILRGEELHVSYKVVNTGENTLVISAVQASCSCITTEYRDVIPAGGEGFINLTFNSFKNIGYVKQFITIVANIKDPLSFKISFDVNVVPNALYIKDYEEIYYENRSTMEAVVKHNKTHYYTGSEDEQ